MPIYTTQLFSRRTGRLTICAALICMLAACKGDLLGVDRHNVVTPSQLEGPAGVLASVNGLVGDFQEAFDDYVRYSALFTDEMILAGTFPTRIDVDERNVQLDPNNGTITDELYTPLQVSRTSADQGIEAFSGFLEDTTFADVQDQLLEGIALGHLYGAYDRVFLGELYCQAVLEPKGQPLLPDAVMQAALERFKDAEAAAKAAELDDVATAARVGQARALLWLGQYDEAAAIARNIPEDFVYFANYSDNQNSQANEIYAFTTGSNGVVLRWTVGDGTSGNRHNERWTYYDEWLAQGLLIEEPDGLEAVEIGIPVILQTLYADASAPILLASGWEAQMIVAEAELRGGLVQQAEDRVNAILTDPSANPMLKVNPDLELSPFQPVDFTGTLATDLPQLARARSAGLWLSGTRQGTLRRFLEHDGVDLYPQGTQGNDHSFPLPQQELDNNPNAMSACP